MFMKDKIMFKVDREYRIYNERGKLVKVVRDRERADEDPTITVTSYLGDCFMWGCSGSTGCNCTESENSTLKGIVFRSGNSDLGTDVLNYSASSVEKTTEAGYIVLRFKRTATNKSNQTLTIDKVDLRCTYPGITPPPALVQVTGESIQLAPGNAVEYTIYFRIPQTITI